MNKIISWIKNNKLTFLLFLVVSWLVWNEFRPSPVPFYKRQPFREVDTSKLGSPGELKNFFTPETVPASEATERLVIKESFLSLLVKNVVQIQEKISQKVTEIGGYIVQRSVSYPEEKEAASGWITVRVPQDKLGEVIYYFRNLAVRVISENLTGQDVTDEYVDMEARLTTLLKTKEKFENILARAEAVEEILKVQKELINLQEQIDNLKGRQNFLKKNTELSKITVYLATDELVLPYSPAKPWQPKAIFKQAVRSLIVSVRKIGTAIIWGGVYSVIWLPALIVYLFWRRKRGKVA